MNYRYCYGSNEWGETRHPPQNKGSPVKGRRPNPVGMSLRTDPGGKAYRDSGRALKTNEGAVMENMHLLSEFTNYGD